MKRARLGEFLLSSGKCAILALQSGPLHGHQTKQVDRPVFMTIDSKVAPSADAKTVLAAGIFGYTRATARIAHNENIDAKRFLALYGDQAFEALTSYRH